MAEAIRDILERLVLWIGVGEDLRLQCPWSNCFPQLYADDTSTCAITAFASFRRLKAHIKEKHSQTNTASEVFQGRNLKIMTANKAEELKQWSPAKYSNHRVYDRKCKDLYMEMCRTLFGEGIQVEDPQYHHFVLEFSVNPKSRKLGETNLAYIHAAEFDQHRMARAPATTIPPQPHDLDEDGPPPPTSWGVSAHTTTEESAKDSGYISDNDREDASHSDGAKWTRHPDEDCINPILLLNNDGSAYSSSSPYAQEVDL
ncbi:hypothetical protein F5Y18DRAFT_317293 [Xylariaceae sp. FL1019]|nr:hypothetical protein F5Y18DRAFT_317293 [Xylariaceae sp. FL1019]